MGGASAARIVAPSHLRRKDHAKTGRSVTLQPDHPAVRERRTLFPKSVKPASEALRLLKSGHNSSKIGKQVTKGKLAGAPIFTLTLQERATCPSTCHHWLSCYGNNMHWAERIDHLDPAFLERLWVELCAKQIKHPDGFLVRLHVLGDFFSEAYVKWWLHALDAFPALHVFGYTARGIDTPIGKMIYTAAQARWSRFAIRISGEDWRQGAAPTVNKGEKHAVAITCPAQTNKTECCGTCTLCWSSRKSVAFEQHGGTNGVGETREPETNRIPARVGRGEGNFSAA
jgi:hypothetical protein